MVKLLKEELKFNSIKDIRGRGLFTAVELHEDSKVSAWNICIDLAKQGILCKPTHQHIIRLTPTLVIDKSDVEKIVDMFKNSFNKLNA